MTPYISARAVATARNEAGSGLRRTFGWELRLQLSGCDPHIVDDTDAVAAYGLLLCEKIGMTPYGPPIVDRFGEGDLLGVTLVQRITTSAIVLHADPPDGAYINVFSCRRFDPQVAIDVTVAYFGATAGTGDFTIRRAPATGSGFSFG